MRNLLERIERGDSIDSAETVEVLRLIRASAGYSRFSHSYQMLNRERIEPGREKHQQFPPTEYQRLFGKQGGVCPGYKVPPHALLIPATKNHVDRIDPHAKRGYNDKRNRQLLCPDCNKRKSSKDLLQQSRETGETIAQIVERGQ